MAQVNFPQQGEFTNYIDIDEQNLADRKYREYACFRNQRQSFIDIFEIPIVGSPLFPSYVHVFRDDVMCGGTKERIALPFLRDIDQRRAISNQSEIKEFVYASSWYGGCQIALAHAVGHLNAERQSGNQCRAVIVTPAFEAQYIRAYSRIAMELYADILEVDETKSGNIDTVASNYSMTRNPKTNEYDRYLIPNGFHSQFTINLLAEDCGNALVAYNTALNERRQAVGSDPQPLFQYSECWCAVGSGTTMQALKNARIPVDGEMVPIARAFHGVHVFGDAQNAMLVQNPLYTSFAHNTLYAFKDPVPLSQTPPYPSSSRYDAKCWEPALVSATSASNRHILIWNVM